VPEDRKEQGLLLEEGVRVNVALATLPRRACGPFVRHASEREVAARQVADLGVRTAGLEQVVSTLSGGNQQKVVVGRWLAAEPRLLLLDEPTRGVDVGAKREIYQHLDRFTARGIAIVLESSDLPELLALADRIVVLHRGRVTARLDRGQATPERVLHAAMGEVAGDAPGDPAP
jgi:ABC-type sugar transport system ATPase subunit